MHVTVTAHQLGGFGQRRLVRHATRLADRAAVLVQRARGPLPPVNITLTRERAMIQLSCAADEAFVPDAGILARRRQLNATRRSVCGAYGVTTLDPATAGGIQIHINAQQAADGELAPTLVHELVHAAQFAEPGARDQHIAWLHHLYGVRRWPRREVTRHQQLMNAREEEAYRLESLAAQL